MSLTPEHQTALNAVGKLFDRNEELERERSALRTALAALLDAIGAFIPYRLGSVLDGKVETARAALLASSPESEQP